MLKASIARRSAAVSAVTCSRLGPVTLVRVMDAPEGKLAGRWSSNPADADAADGSGSSIGRPGARSTLTLPPSSPSRSTFRVSSAARRLSTGTPMNVSARNIARNDCADARTAGTLNAIATMAAAARAFSATAIPRGAVRAGASIRFNRSRSSAENAAGG